MVGSFDYFHNVSLKNGYENVEKSSNSNKISFFKLVSVIQLFFINKEY